MTQCLTRRSVGRAVLGSIILMVGGCHLSPSPSGAVPIAPDFWVLEAESEQASVQFHANRIEIDTPGGLTLWYAKEVVGPVRISFDAMPVARGEPNDEVSDLNAFWMARNTDGTLPTSTVRNGAFASYDTMQTYYVGIGGNRNSTTRFRRYVGQSGVRPMLPHHDLRDQSALLRPNIWTHIDLIADNKRIEVWRDGALIFSHIDLEPYTKGQFGFRTTKSHFLLKNFRIEKP